MCSSNFKYQKGVFSIEFSIVGIVFALALVFVSDVVLKMSMKGKLDRASFSAVNLLKERTALFGQDDFDVSGETFQSLEVVVVASMKRMLSGFDEKKFAMAVDVWTEDSSTQTRLKDSKFDSLCSSPSALEQAQTVKTSWGRYASLYRVTLCYDTDNLFGKLVNESYKRVQSSSLMIGR